MGTACTSGDMVFCLFLDTTGRLSLFLFFRCASTMAHSKHGLEGAVGNLESTVSRSFPLDLGAVVHEYNNIWIYQA